MSTDNVTEAVAVAVAEDKRIYVGGLAPEVTSTDIEKRFKNFGDISSVEVIESEFTGKCRGFAYLNINITPANWKKCYSMYNGTKWKGHQLKLEEAKTDYMTKLKKEWADAKARAEKPKKKRRGSCDGSLAADMTLVNEKNMDGRKGWKRGRYGRAVAVMKLTKLDGTPFTYDPSHYKNNLEKLFGSVKPLPISKLTWSYEKGDDMPNYLISEEPSIPAPTPAPVAEPRKPTNENAFKEQANEHRLEALKRRQEEQERSKKMIKESLSNIDGKKSEGHIVFEDSSEEGQSHGKTLFDSDSDDDQDPETFDIEINEAFEGEGGRGRLALQKRFGGDERFKLGEDFIDPEETARRAEAKRREDTEKEQEYEGEDGINVRQENSAAMSILNSLFQDSPTPIVEKPTEMHAKYWKPVLRFDPDAEDADELLEHESSEETEDLPTSTYQPSAAPEVSDEKKVVINANLKSVFSSTDGGFALFGGSESESDDEPVTPFAFRTSEVESSEPITPFKSSTLSAPAPVTQKSGALFFFHFHDAAMNKRSSFKEEKVFMRTGSIEEVTSAWKEQRSELTQEYKRKHKSATRKKLKMKRKFVK